MGPRGRTMCVWSVWGPHMYLGITRCQQNTYQWRSNRQVFNAYSKTNLQLTKLQPTNYHMRATGWWSILDHRQWKCHNTAGLHHYKYYLPHKEGTSPTPPICKCPTNGQKAHSPGCKLSKVINKQTNRTFTQEAAVSVLCEANIQCSLYSCYVTLREKVSSGGLLFMAVSDIMLSCHVTLLCNAKHQCFVTLRCNVVAWNNKVHLGVCYSFILFSMILCIVPFCVPLFCSVFRCYVTLLRNIAVFA